MNGYKKVKNMYFTCEDCKESNEKVKMRNSFDALLCTKCYINRLEERKKLENKNKKAVKTEEENTPEEIKSLYGIVKKDEEGKVICNECGLSFDCLAHHLRYSHNINIKEYRRKYKIPKRKNLTSEKYHEYCSDRMKDVDMEKQTKRIFHKKKESKQQCKGQMNIDDYIL